MHISIARVFAPETLALAWLTFRVKTAGQMFLSE
jgi:hypothetical protein